MRPADNPSRPTRSAGAAPESAAAISLRGQAAYQVGTALAADDFSSQGLERILSLVFNPHGDHLITIENARKNERQVGGRVKGRDPVDVHPLQLAFLGSGQGCLYHRSDEDVDDPQIARCFDRNHKQSAQCGVGDREAGLLADLSNAGSEGVFAGLDLAADTVPGPRIRRTTTVQQQ